MFCKVLVALDESNFFGKGPAIKAGKELPEGSTPDGKGIISHNFLCLWSTAEKRTLAYVDEMCFDGPKMASNANTRFSRPASLEADDKQSANTIRLCATTTDTTALLNEKYCTRPFLSSEFEWLKGQVGKEAGFPTRKGSNKSEMAASVIKGRQLLIAKDPNTLEEHARELIGEPPSGNESDLKTKTFYKLTEKARAAFRTKRPIARGIEVAEEPATQQSAAMFDLTGDILSAEILDSQSTTRSAAATHGSSPPSKRVRFSFEAHEGDSKRDDEEAEI